MILQGFTFYCKYLSYCKLFLLFSRKDPGILVLNCLLLGRTLSTL